MIKRFNDFKTELRENMRGGDGVVVINNFVTPEELNNKGRLFAKLVLRPGCGVGYHIHENESELFYIIKGTAVYDDNGTKVTVSAGEVTITSSGEGHAIKNETNDDVELIALIVKGN